MAQENFTQSPSAQKRKVLNDGNETRRKKLKKTPKALPDDHDVARKHELNMEEGPNKGLDDGSTAKRIENGDELNELNDSKKRKAPAADNIEDGADDMPSVSPDAESQEVDKHSSNQEPDSRQTRFIVFVGNLPYTATTAALESHFASLKPTSIRHLTQKDDPSKSKGFAFLEFAQYDRMKTCLKLYHHSQFDDGKSAPRRINVELTAGGGGRSKSRKAKLKAKNEKLGHQRKQQNHLKKQEKDSKQISKATNLPASAGDTELHQMESSDVHPSRRGLVKESR